MNMLHENNQKAIAQWQAKDYANAYRDYQNNFMLVVNWFSDFMPETQDNDSIYEFYKVCEKFHEMGF